MSGARPVRIARPARDPDSGLGLDRGAEQPAPEDRGGRAAAWANEAASRRAFRLALLYALGVAVVYYVFVLLGSYGPGGGSPSERYDLAFLGLLAAAVALGGFLVTLRAAPRSIEVVSDGWTVHLPLGGVREYSRTRGARLRRVRSVGPGWLAPDRLAYVEVTEGSVRRAYWIDEELFEALSA